MEVFFTLLPVVLLMIYSTVRMLVGKTKMLRTLIMLLPVGSAVLWWSINLFFSTTDTTLILLIMLIILSFELLHARNRKRSIVFHLLFYLSVAFITTYAVFYRDAVIWSEYILLLIYLLTEANQNYMKKSYEESAAEYQNKILTKQVNEVQNIYMTMRGWRHDYHNHLQTLKAHLFLGQFAEAKGYLDKLESDLDSINHLIETGNVNLDAILNSKLSLALKDEIEINYKAEVPPTLTVSDIDLCVLIGNLIDNAVEACDKLSAPDERRFIRLYIGVMKKQLYISVTNTTNEMVRKMDEEFITTKRGNHGHGLKRINNIVNKYEGFINRKNEPGVFVTEIMLPL